MNSSNFGTQLNPSNHREPVAQYACATPEQVNGAIDAALKAKPAWEALPFEDRAAIFLRASELIAGKYRSDIVASTMLGQGKNIWQAEIEAPSETVDFFRIQPISYIKSSWKRVFPKTSFSFSLETRKKSRTRF
ncbi:delta-1-pyrroline-5-carboxylate dehydrogenase [Colletotrichum limetticola]|uniref:Delta-1-pyrroline-5-carboxylate dehydrogenase n=1 Tax=Colletotrichum limetticola TaxID=1209924 RepID=A0ABQ9P7Q3_9PEZI|nr:delta-1-pyrroline-5-carboxylate dehydrogenase [Colletotrichum limetticola]